MHSLEGLGQHSCRVGDTKVTPRKIVCKALDKNDNIRVGDLPHEEIPDEGRVITGQKPIYQPTFCVKGRRLAGAHQGHGTSLGRKALGSQGIS